MKVSVKRSTRMLSISLIITLLASLIMVSNPKSVKAAESQYIAGSTFDERADSVMNYLATTMPSNPVLPKAAMGYYAARLIKGVDTDFAKSQISSILTNYPLFESNYYPFTLTNVMFSYLIAKDQYNSSYGSDGVTTLGKLTENYLSTFPYMRDLHKDGINEINPVKRDTYTAPNFELMTYGTGYLAAEQWPNDFTCPADSGATYFPPAYNAGQIKAFCLTYLNKYFDSITQQNIDEHGPEYYGINMYVMKMLADFAQGPVVKNKAKMTLDWMMLSLAGEWNNGYWVGTSDRSKDYVGTKTSPDEPEFTDCVGWLFFGGKRGINADGFGESFAAIMAYKGDYKVPTVLYDIANDRKTASVKKESMLNGAADPNPTGQTGQDAIRDKRKYTYQSQNYGMSSEYDFTASPQDYIYKEQRRKMFKWVSDKPLSTFVPMMENRNSPATLPAAGNAFGYGENPYEQVLQNKGTMIGVYNPGAIYVPSDPNYGFYRMYAPFSKTGSIVKKVEAEGWVFCHAGSMLFAFKSIKPYVMDTAGIDYDVLWSEAMKNGWILETSELAPYATGNVDTELAAFQNDILTKTSIDSSHIDDTNPRIVYTALDGTILDLTYRTHGTESQYADQCKINGTSVDYSSYPMVDSPWAHQEVYNASSGNPNILTLNYNGYNAVYDFTNWTITESGTPLPDPAPVSMPIVTPPPAAPVTIPLPAGSPWFKETFESGNADMWIPSTTYAGKWSMAVDGNTTVCQQTYIDNSEDWYCKVLNSASMTAMDVTAKVKVNNFMVNNPLSQAFIGVRATDTDHMYFVALKNSAIEIRKRTGNNTTLVSKPYTITPGVTYDVRVMVKDFTISLFINGVLELTAIDSNLSSGTVAFGTAKAAAEFDDIAVYNLSSAPIPAPTVYNATAKAAEKAASDAAAKYASDMAVYDAVYAAYLNNASVTSTVYLTPEADTFVKKGDTGSAATANGSATTVVVKNDTNNTGGTTRYSLLRFDLSPVLAAYPNGTITGASLSLALTKRNSNAPTLAITNTVNLLDQDNWDEGKIIWTTTQVSPYTSANGYTSITDMTFNKIVDYSVPLTVPTSFAIDLSNASGQMSTKLHTNKKLSLLLNSATANTNGDVSYASKENATTAYRPTLAVTVTSPAARPVMPTPPTVSGVITTNGLPSAIVNTDYGQQVIQYANFQSTVAWSVYNGELPAGLSLTSFTDSVSGNVYGMITGTPVIPGIYNFTLRATDGTQAIDKDFMIPVFTPDITPTSAIFDRNTDNQADIPITITPENAVVTSVVLGSTPLVPGSDYTADTVFGNTYSLSKSCLSKLAASQTPYPVTFNFVGGSSKVVNVTVIDTTDYEDSIITPVTATFDKNAEKQSDVSATVALNGNILRTVVNGTANLVEGTDYILLNNVLSISKAYLAGFSNGSTVSLTLKFSAGADQTFNIAIVDTTPGSVETPQGSGNGSVTGSVKDPDQQITNLQNGSALVALNAIIDNKNGEASSAIDKATLDKAFSQAKADSKGEKTVVLQIGNVPGAKTIYQQLPGKILTSAQHTQNIAISSQLGTVVLPDNMLNTLNLSSSSDISIEISSSDASNLPAEIRSQIGSRPVIELYILVDGKKIEWENPDANVSVSIPYKPTSEELKNPEHLTVWYIDKSGNPVSVSNGKYDPASGTVTFTTAHFSQYAIAYVFKSFNDIADYSWAKEQIEAMASKGIINGTTESTFNPGDNISRADFTMLLVKALGLSSKAASNFADVTKADYFYEAVGTAKVLSLANGSGNNMFNPNEQISRQDMIVLAARAMRMVNKLKSAGNGTDLDKFTDHSEVADYAVGEVAAMTGEGLVTGSNNAINPLGNATRAEAAVLIYRMYNK